MTESKVSKKRSVSCAPPLVFNVAIVAHDMARQAPELKCTAFAGEESGPKHLYEATLESVRTKIAAACTTWAK
jgi:hypothetical protein